MARIYLIIFMLGFLCKVFGTHLLLNGDDCSNANKTHSCKRIAGSIGDDFKNGYKKDSKINEDQKTLNKFVSRKLLSHLPVMDIPSAAGVSVKCVKQFQKYIDGLEKLQLWALKIHDSTAKLPSGLLNGNINQLGDFDQCLKTSDGSGIEGKYCLAAFQFNLVTNTSKEIKQLFKLFHSHFAFTSDLEDSGHRVPRFQSVNWGVCVPSACNHNDVQVGLKYYLSNLLDGADIDVKVRVDEEMCRIHTTKPFPIGTLIAGIFFSLVVAIAVFATIYDHFELTPDNNKYLMSFSLKHNIETILSSVNSKEDIKCVHGIRFMNSIMLIISHKSMAIMFLPFVNRTLFVEEIGKPWTVMSRAASLYTDPFIMISGLLTTYSILRKLKRKGSIALAQEYTSRLTRIIPPFGALILFCTWIMPWLNSGPMWNQVVTHHSDICRKYWWRNMLFIHNYFGFENICLTHTHHVGIDTQLFLLTPPVVLALWKYPRRTIQLLLALATMSTIARYYNTYTMGLSNFVFFGTSVKQLFATADNMYILPFHRATVYILGVLLGFLLHHSKDYVLSKLQLRVGWAVTSSLFALSFFAPAHMGNIDYVYNATESAWYAAFAPIGWCSLFAWVIYTSQQGQDSWVSQLFSWKYYALWTKISYAVYLTQFPVFFYNVGVTRTPLVYDFLSQLFNVKDWSMIIVTALLLTLFIEMPTQNLRAIFFSEKRSKIVVRVENENLTTVSNIDETLKRK